MRDLFVELALEPGEFINYSNLFHYTNSKAKEKILYGDYIDFCLSRTEDFLDKNEGIQILEPFYLACGTLYENETIDEEFYLILRSINANTIRNYNSGAWILCLTPNGNSQYMKLRYAAKGCIIGIPELPLDDLCIKFPADFGRINLCKVEYSFEKMYTKFKRDLEKIYDRYRKCLNDNVSGSKAETISVLKKLMIQYISMICYSYKSSDYKNEEEIRLICYIEKEFSCWNFEAANINVRMLADIDNNDPKLHLQLEKGKYLYCC